MKRDENYMSVFYIGITDTNWYSLLKKEYENGTIGDYVNFWTPGTKVFKALNSGEMFLFKLHNKKETDENGEIVGGGYFSHYEKLTVSEAWQKYGRATLRIMENSLYEMKEKNNIQTSKEIGCIILENVFFFDKCIAEPLDWGKSIVSGKKYDSDTEIGFKLWSEVESLIKVKKKTDVEIVNEIETEISRIPIEGKEREILVKGRINQSIFRTRLLKRYNSCCLCKVQNSALLRASHIKPWISCSPEEKLDENNGFLLCPNHDALFDGGFISFSDDGYILISKELSKIDSIYTNVDESMKICLTEKNKYYLKYHRNNVFLKKE